VDALVAHPASCASPSPRSPTPCIVDRDVALSELLENVIAEIAQLAGVSEVGEARPRPCALFWAAVGIDRGRCRRAGPEPVATTMHP